MSHPFPLMQKQTQGPDFNPVQKTLPRTNLFFIPEINKEKHKCITVMPQGITKAKGDVRK